jgi:hypothetical protein
VRGSLAGGDLDGAETVLGGVVRDFVGRLAADEMHDDRGDIYNGGAAISEDALRAYIAARRGDLVFIRRDVQVAQLAPPLREKFVFPGSVLRMVLAVSSGNELEQLFVFVGRALFRGFEKQGGLGVYEMIAPENPLFALLAQHHLRRWLAEQETVPGAAAAGSGTEPQRSNG